MRMLLLVLMLKKVFKTNFREGKNYENQSVKFWIGKRDHYGSRVDNLLAVGLDDAGRDDEYDREYGSYGYEQIRLDAFTHGFLLGTYCVEHIRRNFRVASGSDLQYVDQRSKTLRLENPRRN